MAFNGNGLYISETLVNSIGTVLYSTRLDHGVTYFEVRITFLADSETAVPKDFIYTTTSDERRARELQRDLTTHLMNRNKCTNFTEMENLRHQLAKLEIMSQISILEAQLKYAPGAVGAVEAKQEFNKALSASNLST
jgi:hypothetical protein